jgi:hypothetical protein
MSYFLSMRELFVFSSSTNNILFVTNCYFTFVNNNNIKEELLRGRPGFEHLNEPLHILIEAELPVNVVEIRLRQAQEIIEELLKPVVSFFLQLSLLISALRDSV